MASVAGGRAPAQRDDISSAESSQPLSLLEESEEGTHQSSYGHGYMLSNDNDDLSISSCASEGHSSSPPSTSQTADDSYFGQPRHVEAARAGTETKNGCRGGPNAVRRSLLPLRQVVACRAFECVVGAQGVLSKVLDVDSDRNSSEQSEDRDYQTELDEAIEKHERNPTRDVEPVPYGADIDVEGKDSSEVFWGVDLHMCDLGSLVGLPAERGGSPWASNASGNESDEERLWRCVYLDVSLNRLRGITVVADQPSLRSLAYLDVSHNLIEDLDTVQDLSSLQVLLASNNQISSVQALGERRFKEISPSSTSSSCPSLSSRPSIRHVDLSNNSIATVKAPLFAQAFRHVKSLRLASNRLVCFEEDAAHALTSLEWLDISGNELVSVDWVALLESLRFLDCSENRISTLSTFARALSSPARLEEVIAEGNLVVEEPRYRITVLTKCKRVRRLDHRPVDGTALKRQLDLATQTKVLDSVRETANDEYHCSVEGERSRLERRKEILRAQERQLDEAFQGYRLQKQREMGECIAYAESLRGDDGQGLLTPQVAYAFREAVGDNTHRPPTESEHASSGNVISNSKRGDDGGLTSKGYPAAAGERSRSLKCALSAAVDQERPESIRSDGSKDGSDRDGGDDGDHSSAFGDEFSRSECDLSDGRSRGDNPQHSSGSEGSGTTRRGQRRGDSSARVRGESHEKGAKGDGSGGDGSRRGIERERPHKIEAKQSITSNGEWGEDEPDGSPVGTTEHLPKKKSAGGGIFKTLGWRRAER